MPKSPLEGFSAGSDRTSGYVSFFGIMEKQMSKIMVNAMQTGMIQGIGTLWGPNAQTMRLCPKHGALRTKTGSEYSIRGLESC